MKLAIGRLLDRPENRAPSPKAIERFLSKHNFPIVEGTRLTFVYRGAADAVLLQHFIYGLETSQPFERVKNTDLWYLTLEVPPRSTIQYKLNVVRGGEHHWIQDPLNPNLAHDPFGANSVCSNDGQGRPDWTLPIPKLWPGELHSESIVSEAFGQERGYRLYLPARFRSSRRYPLLVVHDGSDYLRFSDLKTVFDNLIHRLEMAPVVVALTDAASASPSIPTTNPTRDF